MEGSLWTRTGIMPAREVAAVLQGTARHLLLLLMVVLSIRGHQGPAFTDTGCDSSECSAFVARPVAPPLTTAVMRLLSPQGRRIEV